jgi:hypothetical protein
MSANPDPHPALRATFSRREKGKAWADIAALRQSLLQKAFAGELT